MSRNDGGPAFPGEQGHIPDGTWNQTWCEGMSLREFIATKTAAALVPDYCQWMREAEPTGVPRTGFDDVPKQGASIFAEQLAHEAVIIADALLAQLAKERRA